VRTDRSVPLLVTITGPPASGKTTIAQVLARELRLPLVAKDGIKETLFDALGTGDRDWSKRLGRATFAVMLHWLAIELGAGRAAIAEANFHPGFARALGALPAHRMLQLYCTAPRELLLARYGARTRHAGHLDREVLAEWERGEHDGLFAPLPTGGELLELDTSGQIDVAAVIERVRASLAR
jgi:predicted kinase